MSYYKFEQLDDEKNIRRRRSAGRIGAILTGFAAAGSAWMAFNLPMFEVEENGNPNDDFATAIEVVARTPQVASALIFSGLTINFVVGSRVLTGLLNENIDTN